MSDKFYVETDEFTAYADSTAVQFHADQPFDNVEDAKKWAYANPGQGYATIYRCSENILKPILARERHSIEGWEDVE